MQNVNINKKFNLQNQVTLFEGNCIDLIKQIPDNSVQLVVTSPPYNIGKEYEKKRKLDQYLEFQERVIGECFRVLNPQGSIAWQVGNYIEDGHIIPLDVILYPIFNKLGMQMRNRIIWHFGHGLHASKRFSGRYETIIWFTKNNNYYFNLDSVRVPQKYPNKKHFKGPNRGKLSGNPFGKNPSDVWDIPNVKSNHVEKTPHPCQFPVALAERLILSMTRSNDIVLDPFMGAGTTSVAAILNNRKSAGAEIDKKYVEIARERISKAANGSLKVRPDMPVYNPSENFYNRMNKIEPNLTSSFI